MDNTSSLQFETPLPRPQRGSSTRVRLGANELVLEAVRGGQSLLWSDGREARKFALGVPTAGDLWLELRAPQAPIRVALREVMAVVPGGRLRGYLQVPLVPTVVWRTVDSAPLTVVELLPRELAAEWDDAAGATCCCTSSLHVRFPMRSGDPRAIVPVVVRNLGRDLLSPPHLPVQFRDAELVALRGCLAVAPRRLLWNDGWRQPGPAAVGVPA